MAKVNKKILLILQYEYSLLLLFIVYDENKANIIFFSFTMK